VKEKEEIVQQGEDNTGVSRQQEWQRICA